jgi:DNA topoisomerase-1
MLAFGKALPGIRRRVARDLALPGMPRNKVLATLVRLLETTHIRVGNEEYQRTNHSFGLTTLRNRHVEVRGRTLRFEFRGKGGKLHNIAIEDPRVARIVRQCQDIPGQHLFQYLDSEGRRHSVTSSHLNEYLHDIAGEEFTAKDFRTWAGTLLTARELRATDVAKSASQSKQNVVEAIRRTAQHLGNTPAICRQCYVHPEVLRSYLNENSAAFWKRDDFSRTSYRSEEKALLKFLRVCDRVEKRLLALH